MSEAPLCVARGISRGFAGHRVLDEFDLTVNAGEMVAVTGPSGSGKTTALNILGLLEHFDAGELQLFGARAPAPHTRAARLLLRNRLGYLFQNFALVDTLDILHNLAIAQVYPRRSRAIGRRERAAVLERVGLRPDLRRPIFTLSGGEQQRLAIARLLLKPARLVLADEPTGSLDPDNRDRILELLTGLAREGRGIVLVTHDLEVAARCDRRVDLTAASS
ncbi:ATP-binding cassette domain-containing protein [Mycetocola saprophilus]|uniref:ATP-binding cassette domain-containing protein n=1 Tax=Mycetocola saprophilus TaxID=76636 RepID=UPI0004BEAF1F|nr:ATP-binding cassette domain-containing protein [Mycetocola saprophilus]